MEYEIKPLIGVNDLVLGLTIDEIINQFGEPRRIQEDLGYKVLHYKDLVFTISPEGKCDEIKVIKMDSRKIQAYLNEKTIFGEGYNEIVDFLKTLDPNLEARLEDYASSLELGIAIYGTSRNPRTVKAISVSSKGFFKTIDSLLEQ